MKILKNLNLNYPISDIFILIYKFNTFLFIFFLFLYFYFFIFFSLFFLYNFFLKNNKFFFLKNFLIEFFWIFFPFYISLIFFYYSLFLILLIKKKYLFYLNIKIVSYQWKWYFLYFNKIKNLNYFSVISTCIFKIFNVANYLNFNYIKSVDNNLVLPSNKIIRFIFVSNDVIHSLYIPYIGLKQDILPGFLKNFYFICNKFGKYNGFCTELCGRNHSYMPFIINVLNLESYKKWTLVMFFKKSLFLNY